MASTPTTWLDDFIVNTTTDGNQAGATVTSLTNGNVLVTWSTNNDTGVGSPNSTDIIGQMFDAFGNPIDDEFRLNTSFSADTELDAEVTALPNGGFIIVYEDINDDSDISIRLEEFNGDGNRVSSSTSVVNDTDGVFAGGVSNPVIAAGSASSVMIAYERNDGLNQRDIVFKIYDPINNTYSAEQPLLSNNGIFSGTDITALDNGNYVITGSTSAFPSSVKMRIIDSQGNNVLALTTVGNTDTTGLIDFEADVTALKEGGFVVAWRHVIDPEHTDIQFQMYTSNGVAVGPVRNVANGNPDTEITVPTVVGLDDGGFLVIYSDDEGFFDATRVERFDTNGNKVGETYDLSLQTGTVTEATLMEDGRVAIVWADQGNIHMEILDPRDGIVNVDPGDQITVAGLDDTTINGSIGNDNIFGQNGDDIIKGRDGEDTIDGRNGDDTITGGKGNDTIRGGNGRDNIKGGQGTDNINGGSGNDIIEGGLGTDTIIGGTGNDTIIVREGQFYDNVNGGSGVDTLDHSETVRSGTTFDFDDGKITGAGISGSSATLNSIERFEDGNGSNTIISDGFGEYFGNGGDDIMVSNEGVEFMDGGAGVDTVDHSFFTGDLVFNLNAGLTSIDGEQFLNFENAIMGSGDDLVVGNGADNTIDGGAGDDFIEGASGDDQISGGSGNDEIEGGRGEDFLFGGEGNDEILGGRGVDSVFGGAGNDVFTVSGSDEYDNVRGGDGIDTLDHSASSISGTTIDFSIRSITGEGTGGISLALEGIEIFKDGRGSNTIISDGSGSYNGGAGDDLMVSNEGAEIMVGGSGIDTIDHTRITGAYDFDMTTGETSIADESFTGFENAKTNRGANIIEGTEGANEISTGRGRDVLNGNGGDDILRGAKGKDRLFGGDGDDILIGGKAKDILNGGAGADTFVFAAKQGKDVIQDFEDGVDLIDLSAFGFSNKDAALRHFEERGSDSNDVAGFKFKGTEVKIKGLDLDDISGADILI